MNYHRINVFCSFFLLPLSLVEEMRWGGRYLWFLLTHDQAKACSQGLKELGACCVVPESFRLFIARPLPEVPGFNGASFHLQQEAVCHALGFLFYKTDKTQSLHSQFALIDSISLLDFIIQEYEINMEDGSC